MAGCLPTGIAPPSGTISMTGIFSCLTDVATPKERAAAILRFFLLLVAVLVTASGCAGRAQPPITEINPEEREMVVAAFSKWRGGQPHCEALDAEAQVFFSSSGWLGERSDKIAGYLQAMPPSYLKFVGINPLGQPLLVLTTDGNRYRYMAVPVSKAYEGGVDSEAFRKYVPAGFSPAHCFYWLTGRLPADGFRIGRVWLDSGSDAYWLELKRPESDIGDHLLIDLQDYVLRRRILQEEGGEILMDVAYGEYALLSEGEGDCRLPRRITISRQDGGKVEIILQSFAAGASFSEADFQLEPPAGFERIVVE